MIEEIMTGDVFGAEGQNVGGGLLTVHEMKSSGLQLPDQRDQGNFRCIWYMGEHRLCEKGASSTTP